MIQEILLKRVRNVTRIIYSSAIAHQLAAKSQQTVTEIAAQLVVQLQQGCREQTSELALSLPWPSAVLPELTIWATDSGLIQIELSDRAIATWLNFLLDEPLPLVTSLSSQQPTPSSNCDRRIFAIQHAHARCCSLLRLADRERLIQLCSPETEGIVWPFKHPVTIPWLDPNGRLYLQSATERRLISQLFTVMEQRSPQSAPLRQIQLLRLAEDVSQAFDAFHRDRPLLARPRESSQEVIHARLGLVLATQRVLHCLLQQGLNCCAPQEL